MPNRRLLAAAISQLLVLNAAHAAPSPAADGLTVSPRGANASSPPSEPLQRSQITQSVAPRGQDYIVNSIGDDGDGDCGTAVGQCTLRDAVIAAEANVDTSVIRFDPAVFAVPRTITLTAGELAMQQSTTITGPGANLLTIDAAGQSRIFHFANLAAPSTALNSINAISGLTLTGGNANSGTPDPGGRGGAIRSVANLDVVDSVISGNNASFDGGAVWSRFRDLKIERSTLLGNSVVIKGGGIYARQGTLTISNSTISGNRSGNGTSGPGGGVYNDTNGMTITNSTISGNISPGAAVKSTAAATLNGSIVADSNNADLDGSFNATDSLIENAGSATFLTASNLILGMDPMLGAPGDNGGGLPTQVPALQSPALDHYTGCSGTDQRGQPRGVDVDGTPGNDCDIGAVEYGVTDDRLFADGFDPGPVILEFVDGKASLGRAEIADRLAAVQRPDATLLARVDSPDQSGYVLVFGRSTDLGIEIQLRRYENAQWQASAWLLLTTDPLVLRW